MSNEIAFRKPEAPKRLEYRRNGVPVGTFAVAADEVVWSDDYDGWECTYTTTDERIMPEFRSWTAVWDVNESMWVPADV